jgi:hypothetical protein
MADVSTSQSSLANSIVVAYPSHASYAILALAVDEMANQTSL